MGKIGDQIPENELKTGVHMNDIYVDCLTFSYERPEIVEMPTATYLAVTFESCHRCHSPSACNFPHCPGQWQAL
jgi:hypothetical protein